MRAARSRRPHRCRRALLAVAALVAAAACDTPRGGTLGCGEGDVVTGRPLRVVTTVSPITSLAAAVVEGTDVEVVGVVPEGRDSHEFDPEPSVASAIEDADVILLNGLGLEEPTRRLAEAARREGSVLCELGTTVLPEDRYLFDEAFPEAAGVPNPHLWTNPPLAAEYVELIASVLSVRRPADADRFDDNAGRLIAAIDELDEATRRATATIPPDRRLLLTYHDAFAYTAEEYGWTRVGAVQPATFDEPSPREIADLVDQIRTLGVPAIFGSEVFPSPVLEQLADETGVTYVDDLRDDDLPGEPGDPDHSWFELIRFDLVTIVEGLGGDASELRALAAPQFDDSADYP